MSFPPVALPTPLVDVPWLQTHLTAPDLVIVDCRFALSDPQQGHREYQAGHIPGAYYFDLNEVLSNPAQSSGGRHPLPNISEFLVKLKSVGMTSHPPTQMVAYDASKGAFAARLWWLLRYLGHDAVAVLDGGFPAWQRAGWPTATDPPPRRSPGQFVPQVRRDWVVDRATVKQCQTQRDLTLVDARSPERYRGEEEPIDPVAGSIPTAINFFWQDNLDGQGFFKSSAALTQLWQDLPAANQSIYYCGSGVTACVNLLAQAVMGHPMPRLYAGGWSDWCMSDPRL